MNSRRLVNSAVMLLRFSLAILLLSSACSRAQVVSPLAKNPVLSPTPRTVPTPTPSSAIRSVDFENFTYPHIHARGTFTLKDGREPNVEESRSVIDVIYGDVTADGNEDAMVVQSQNIHGSAIPYFVYVFTVNGAKPKLLWSFVAGDRAQGGLRRVFAENGNLAVELYGDKAYVGMPNYDASADCAACATRYTRAHYAWQKNRFRRIGNLEVVAHDGSANYLG
jgi:hypothetical protein